MVCVAQEYQFVSFTKPVYCFWEGIYQSVALHPHLYGIVFCGLTGQRVSPLGCICLVLIDFYKKTLGTELLLHNYYNNVTVISKRRVGNTDIIYEYLHANTTKAIENDSYV